MKKFIPIAFVALFLVPSLTFASFDTSLKYGNRGDAVSTLQDFLSDQGFLKGSVDGKFGLGTLRAVEAFQTANGLDSDGYFGLASRTAANAILATIIAPSDKEEQAETGTVTTPVSPVLDSRGCSTTSLYSSTTGVSCTIVAVTTVNPQTAQLQQEYTLAELKANLYNIANASAQVISYAGGAAYFSSHPTEMAELNADLGDSTCAILVGASGMTTQALIGAANNCISKLSIAIEQNNQLIQSLVSQIQILGGQLPPLPMPQSILPLANNQNSVVQSVNNPTTTMPSTQTQPPVVTPTYTAPVVTIIKNPAVADATIKAGSTKQVIGSFTIQNTSDAEPLIVTNLNIAIPDGVMLSNLTLNQIPGYNSIDNVIRESNPSVPIISTPADSNDFPVTFTIGAAQTINVLADVNSATLPFSIELTGTATGSASHLGATINSATGQTVTIQ